MAYEYMHPIPLSPKTDVNAKVKLHVLCDECKAVSSTIVECCVRRVQTPYFRPLVNPWYLDHHTNSLQLQASADNECHLCTLIWGTLSFSSRKILRDFETELTVFGPSSQSMPKRSYELTIALAGLGDHGEVSLNVALNRDPQGRHTCHHLLEQVHRLGSPRLYLTGKMMSSDVNALDPKYGLRFAVRRSHLGHISHFDLILQHCELATTSTLTNTQTIILPYQHSLISPLDLST
jgi:hypothetical protein